MTALPVATLTDLVRVRAETLGAQSAYGFLADGETETATLTYADLDRQARSLAARLRERVVPGASVLLAYPPGLEFIVGFFGCLYAGVIAVPVCAPHPRKGNERLAAIAIDSGARHALTTAAGARVFAAMAGQSPALGALQVIANELDDAGERAAEVTAAPGSDDIAFLQYTSGSTQRPRGVMVTHANLIANLGAIHAAEGNSAASRGVSWLPAYHDMGLIEGILQPLYGGYPTWLMPPTAFLQRPARWLRAITRFGATVSGGPNFAYDLCLRRVDDRDLAGIDLSGWQVAYCGAEPVRAATLEAFADRFGRCGLKRSALRPVYGLAESTLLVTASRRDAPGPRFVAARKSRLEQGRFELATQEAGDRSLLVSCGIPARGTRLAIVAPDTGAVLPDGMIGEIQVCGASVTRGYRSEREGSGNVFARKTLAGVAGVWLATGDLGFLLDGELYITGRAKDLIILRGRKLHPQDIEHTVECSAACAQIESVAAFALDADDGESLAVCAELSRSGLLVGTDALARVASLSDMAGMANVADMADMANTIRDRVYREHDIAVAMVAFVRPGALARTSSGKLMRYQCRSDLATGRMPIVASFDARSRAAESVPVA